MDKLRNIPVESEEIFLRQRTDIRRDEWELGKAAWRNIRDFGAPTWYDWCISNWGTKWNAYGYSEDTIDYHDGDTLYFQTAWSAPHPVISASIVQILKVIPANFLYLLIINHASYAICSACPAV